MTAAERAPTPPPIGARPIGARPLGDPTQILACAFLEAPVDILVDRWGIPHIRAGSLRDLFFAQGFNAARDRLWQIDLWRKRGLGLLARDFGPGFLMQDEAARLFLYAGDMDREWASYGPQARDICGWFVAGINAFVRETRARPELLPPEFARLGTAPDLWDAPDVVRIRSHSLSRNALSEILRAQVLARADGEVDGLRSRVHPPVPPHLAGAPAPAVPLAAYQTIALASAPVTFHPERMRASLDEAHLWHGPAVLPQMAGDECEGSNNWAVAAARTPTGRPLLASDPHRDYSTPSVRYIVHLTAPGFDAIGAGEAAVPGISIGHNADIAFALTIFSADQEDVYVYELSPEDPDLYRYQDGWERFEIREEVFDLRGGAPVVRRQRHSRHGPVVLHDGARRLAAAMRTVWSEPGTAPYLASLSSMFARDLDGFRAALARWGTPSVNHVYADRGGTIAWLPMGMMPRRPNWSGLTPVPGDGRFEWAGFLAPAELPARIDPQEGFVATANEMNLPAEWRAGHDAMGFEWLEPSRGARIHEVLRAGVPHGVAEACALQADTLSIPARRLQPVFAGLRATAGGPAAEAAGLLAAWDCRMDAGSAAALLYDSWWSRHLKPAVIARLAPAALAPLLAPGDNEAIITLLETPTDRLGGVERRDALVRDTLADAYMRCREEFGAPSRWQWGEAHHALFRHPLSDLEAAPGWDVGPLPAAGSGSTVRLASYRASDFRVTMGASVRLVMDVGAWDNSCCINTPGQAGDPRSPHYGDMAADWAAGRYVPLLFSPARIAPCVTQHIRLTPAPPPGNQGVADDESI